MGFDSIDEEVFERGPEVAAVAVATAADQARRGATACVDEISGVA